MKGNRIYVPVFLLAIGGIAFAQDSGQSNQQLPASALTEESYPLAGDAAREKTTRLLQEVVVDLLATVNIYKQAHWNLSGPLYLPLHEYYDEQATCRIPDDHISVSRLPLFSAREVLRGLLEDIKTCDSGELPL